jgi:hypothetical protein
VNGRTVLVVAMSGHGIRPIEDPSRIDARSPGTQPTPREGPCL